MSYKLQQRLTLAFALLAILAFLSLTVATIGGALSKSKAQGSTDNVAVKDEDSFTLRGKTISFLGDSITTYDGWSNNATYNSTLTENGTKYNSGHFNVNSTWWKQVLNELQLSLCVNNSCDASRVTETKADVPSGLERCTELHRDNGTQPDIIVVYLGTNDLGNGVTLGEYSGLSDIIGYEYDENGQAYQEYVGDPDVFAKMYATMLHKIFAQYPDADVFVCTLLPEGRNDDEGLREYNAAIRSIAAEFGADVIDLYADSGITRANYLQYVYNEDPLYVHPNEAGMDLITDAVVEALTEKYK